MTTYENDIAQSVLNLIKKPVDASIAPYGERFKKDILDTFVCANCADISNYYQYLVRSREALSGERMFDLNDEGFLKSAVGFVNSVYRLFGAYFSQSDRRLYMTDRSLLRTVMQEDIRQNSDDTLSVGLGNPLVLEALVVTKFQLDDFRDVYSAKDGCDVGEKAREAIYREHLLRRIDDIFRDMEIAYGGRFYGIVGYDTGSNAFIAVNDETLCSETPVSAVSLFGDIARFVNGHAAERREGVGDIKILIVGETAPGSIDILKKAADGLNVTIDVMPGEEFADGNFRKSTLDKIIKENDDVYILNCQDTYFPTPNTRQDDLRGRRASARLRRGDDGDLRNIDFMRFFFYGRDLFSDLYCAVQAGLFGSSGHRSHGNKAANRPFFDYLTNILSRRPSSVINKHYCKKMSVYVPDDVDLSDYSNDVYGRICTEVNERNGYDVFVTGTDVGFLPSQDGRLKMTYLDILTAISPSCEFYCEMTDVKIAGAMPGDDVAEAVRRAYGTDIEVEYRGIREAGDKDGDGESKKDGNDEVERAVDVHVKVSYEGFEASEEYEAKVEAVIKELFTPHRNRTPAVWENEPGRCLAECHKKKMDALIYACAGSFDDMLFYHLYAGEGEGVDEIRFIVSVGSDDTGRDNGDTRRDWDAAVGDADGVRPHRTRYNKHVAEYIMNNMDGRYYSESSVVDYLRLVGSSKDRLDGYADCLKTACGNLGYTRSMLYRRLERYF